jgi:hypothetical protein
LICFSLSGLAASGQNPAATAPVATQAKSVGPDSKSLGESLKFRADLAAGVAAGTEDAEAALERLQAQASPTGLKINADADLAYAATDVGHRLIALGKPTPAEVFFRAAELSFTTVISRTADTAAREKVQYLQTRAVLRTNYLAKLAEGRADLDEALRLAPDDKHLLQLRRLIPADGGPTFQKHAEVPSKG